jgi:HD superfamily phosphohydrolase
MGKEVSDTIKQKVMIDPEIVAGIIDDNMAPVDHHVLFFRNLLSGVLDPDKLDYLNRDAYFCGIPYGRQDVEYILNNIHPHPEKGLTMTEQGLSSVESLLFAKYIMYKTVYWHKTVRIATAMVKKALFLGLSGDIIKPSELYDLNDNSLFALAQTHDFKPFSLLSLVANRELYKQIYSTPFLNTNPAHTALEHLDHRNHKENLIAEELSRETGIPVHSEDIIIDIPERISFEIDVPVQRLRDEEHVRFRESGSVFTPETVSNFVHTLRHISVSIKRDQSLISGIKGLDIPAILESGVAVYE